MDDVFTDTEQAASLTGAVKYYKICQMHGYHLIGTKHYYSTIQLTENEG